MVVINSLKTFGLKFSKLNLHKMFDHSWLCNDINCSNNNYHLNNSNYQNNNHINSSNHRPNSHLENISNSHSNNNTKYNNHLNNNNNNNSFVLAFRCVQHGSTTTDTHVWMAKEQKLNLTLVLSHVWQIYILDFVSMTR